MLTDTTISLKNPPVSPANFDSERSSLGNTAKEPSNRVNTAKQHKYTVGNFRLLDATKRILTKYNVLAPRSGKMHRTRTCHSFKQAGVERVTLSLSENPKDSKASITDVQTCGCEWGCPVCFERKALENARDIQKAIAWAESEGLIPVMIALTASHKLKDSLEYTDSRMTKALSLFLGGGAWKQFREDWGVVDYIANRDTTFSFVNGWHPHRHMLVFINPAERAGLDADRDFNEELTDRWLHCLKKYGLKANRNNGLRVSDHKNASGEYLSKLGATVDTSGNLSFEMTMPNSKNSMNIWDILRFADMGLAQYEKLFVEYVEYMTGKTWIRWSKGLRDKVDEFEEEIEESGEEAQNRMLRWLEIGDYWFDVVRAADNGFAKLIEVAATTRDIEEVSALLHELRYELYLNGRFWRREATEFRELNDPNMLTIHEDWINDTS